MTRKTHRIRLSIAGLIIIIVGLLTFTIIEPFISSGLVAPTGIAEEDAADHNSSDSDAEYPTRDPAADLSASEPSGSQGAKSVILMIGDGMGAAHRLAAQYVRVGAAGYLAMDELPVRGELMTSSADRTITDSAASATAMATGYKTNNQVLGLDGNLNYIPTILEEAQALGKSVGLITTTHLAHATPAGFAAHIDSRYAYEEIAAQLSAAEVTVLLGGGEKFFLPPQETGCYPGQGMRTDGRNLIREMVAGGYTYVCEGASLSRIDSGSTTKLLGLFGEGSMTEPYTPTLAEMTTAAIEILSKNPEGFFLMVEGGQIDWGGHDNDPDKVIRNAIALDQAVEVANNYAHQTGDTLFIVTADHETGGMSVILTASGQPEEDGPFEILDGGSFYVNWTTGGHTAANVPLTASGPMADHLSGVYENTYLHELILDAFCSFAGLRPALAEGEDPCGTPLMEVWGNGWVIAHGDVVPNELDGTDFGDLKLGEELTPSVFTITNRGAKSLYITGTPMVEIAGSHPDDFSVNLLPYSPLAFKDGSTTFEITFHPSASGLRTALITIINSDPPQNPYTFAVQGTGVGEGD